MELGYERYQQVEFLFHHVAALRMGPKLQWGFGPQPRPAISNRAIMENTKQAISGVIPVDGT
jgi:hypothetical protein